MLTEIFGGVFARGGCSTHAPFIQRPLISFAHLSPSLLILATRFNRGPCIHVAGVCLGIGFWSCHVWGATPCCMLQVRRGETKEGKGRTTQENLVKQNTKLKDIKDIQYKEKIGEVDKQTKNN